MLGRAARAAEILAFCGVLTAFLARPVGAAEDAAADVPSQCPRAEAVSAGLQPVVSADAAPDETAPTPAIDVVDLGAAFRVSVNGRQREYYDEARDCARRARMAAVFAAIALGLPLAPKPEKRKAAPPEVAVQAPALAPATWTARVQVEVGPAVESGVGSADAVALVGASLRVALGASRVQAVGGVSAFAPGDATFGALTVSHTHVPVDLGVRLMALTGRWDLSLDAGLAGGWLRMRGAGVEGAETATVLEWGARAGAVLRFRAWQRVAPFIGGAAQLVASPADLYALPRGVIGQAPRAWLATTLGASVGF